MILDAISINKSYIRKIQGMGNGLVLFNVEVANKRISGEEQLVKY